MANGHSMRTNLKSCILCIAAVLLIPAVEAAAGMDLYWMWDDRDPGHHTT